MSLAQTRLSLVVLFTVGVLMGEPSRLIASEPPAGDGDLIVHEWGTFTSYSGSDGVRLEFRPLVENDLPEFVYDWSEWTGSNVFTKRTVRARQRMETPVTYFYTDRLREVNVRVGFPEGVLTEFYPPVARLEPPGNVAWAAQNDPHAESLRGGLLDWGRVTLIPESSLRPAGAPEALADAVARRAFESLPPGGDPEPDLYTGDHYYFARQTDSALVHVRATPPTETDVANGATARPLGVSGDFFEKFLFYRGIGNFDLPLSVKSIAADQRCLVANCSSQSLRGLILVRVQGDDVRLSRLEDLKPSESRLVAPPPEFEAADHQSPMVALWDAMRRILVAEGLYEKEALAMIQTWDSSWFREEGTRLLYIVPRELTDRLLPLTVEPAPEQMVRVLVGRLEILSADEERRIEGVVAASAAAREEYYAGLKRAEAEAAASDPLAESSAPQLSPPGVPQGVRDLGRLAEPALVRVTAVSRDAAVRAEATQLLAFLQAETGGE